MRLDLHVVGDIRRILNEDWKAGRKAIRSGIRDTSRGLRDDLRADGAAAGLGKLARVWRTRLYRGRGGAWDSVGFVYPKGGERTRGALWALEYGAIIRPKNARYLLIPTQFNRKRGRRGGKVLYRPEELQDSFVQKSKGGSLLLFARVGHAQTRSNGRVRDRAFVNSQMLGSGRAKRTRDILGYGVVPMFVLVPQVTIRKRLNIRQLTEKWEAKLGYFILRNWDKDNGR